MSPETASLKRRLILWLLGSLAVLSLVIIAHVHYSAQETADDVYDRVLRASALAIAERVVVGENEEIEVDLPYVALEMLGSAAHDRVYYRVESNGSLVTGYRDLPGPEEAAQRASDNWTVYDATYRGAAIRVIAVAGHAVGQKRSYPFTVFVAETTAARRALVQQMTVSAAWRLAATIAAALLIVWLGVYWGLRPLTRLEEALGRRSQNDLRPILHEVPREARNLVQSINDMMGRLAAAIGALTRFTGNAGHQLRTPLSVIKAQLDLAARETDPERMRRAIEEAQGATRQSERLVEQLLMLASLDAESSGRQEPKPFDVAKLAQRTASEFAPTAVKHGCDFGFESDEEALTVEGHEELVAEALRNLIQNALAYCPQGSKVTVRAVMSGGGPALEVEDDGPGIPADARAEAMERFVRLSANGGAGSGLGLAIVQEIAARHGATLELGDGHDGRGLCARIRFPQAATPARSEAPSPVPLHGAPRVAT